MEPLARLAHILEHLSNNTSLSNDGSETASGKGGPYCRSCAHAITKKQGPKLALSKYSEGAVHGMS